ncbi:MAG: glycogen debranching N-terminal domain-containing protein [Thermomicrobiales bacterium]
MSEQMTALSAKDPRDDLTIRADDIGATLTLKEGPLFLLTDLAGAIPPQVGTGRKQGLGLYFHDMRHLDQATLRVNGQVLTPLLASTDLGHRGERELTNPDLDLGDGRTLPRETLGLHVETTLGAAVREQLTLRNFGRETVDLTLTLQYDAHFDDIFTVRGTPVGRRGTLHAPTANGDGLWFRYDGADGHRRTTGVTFTPSPARIDGCRSSFPIRLAPGGAWALAVRIAVADQAPAGEAGALEVSPRPEHGAGRAAPAGWLGGGVQIETSNQLFDRVLRRSFLDLEMLAMQQGEDRYFAAGVPWFVALFGRDSLITALQTLAYAPQIARTTLDLLARYQGKIEDDFRDEEPGKILHELRVGERAHLREVPFSPYYGTIDATPLFLILLGEYLRWTGDRDTFTRLRGSAEAALAWLDRYGDLNGDGFVAYIAKSHKGLFNQGWKDSANCIVNADGSIAAPPIALVEVQGYAYRARRTMAAAFRQLGEHDRAADLDRVADSLYRRFNDHFWLPEFGNYALALQGEARRPAAVDASNQGQALWGGIVDPARAGAVRDALLDPARLFAGWGVRTLSRAAVAYNPFDYQTGAIWPHDNALIGAGLRAYGFDEAALAIFTGMYEAATRFDHYRLPELFAGFSQDDYGVPVRYPVACSPQAWSAGSLPYLLQAILGLAPDAFAGRLDVVRPRLPAWLDRVDLRGVRVGAGTVDLRYERSGATTLTAVVRKEGPLDVAITY